MINHTFESASRQATTAPQTQPTPGHRIVFGLSFSLYEPACIAVVDATAQQLVALHIQAGSTQDKSSGLIALDKTWEPSVS
jgi:hypothetical protein